MCCKQHAINTWKIWKRATAEGDKVDVNMTLFKTALLFIYFCSISVLFYISY